MFSQLEVDKGQLEGIAFKQLAILDNSNFLLYFHMSLGLSETTELYICLIFRRYEWMGTRLEHEGWIIHNPWFCYTSDIHLIEWYSKIM